MINSGSVGPKGVSGPTSITNFEISDGGVWTEKHAILNGLCIQILNFLKENPEIASRVEITKENIRSFK